MSSNDSYENVISVRASNLNDETFDAIPFAEEVVELEPLMSKPVRSLYDEFNVTTNLEEVPVEPKLTIQDTIVNSEATRINTPESVQLNPIERIQLATLESIASMPYMVERTQVQQTLRTLLQAKSVKEAKVARLSLTSAVKASHRKVMQISLTVACGRACQQIGFSVIETMKPLSGSMCLISKDRAGRHLVAEIRESNSLQPQIAVEVVGVTDGSCTSILDAFNAALVKEGVRVSNPDRKFTGGVCDLAAARIFLKKKMSQGNKQSGKDGNLYIGVSSSSKRQLTQTKQQAKF
jgi:hypothetical protein